MSVQILVGDALEKLRELPDESVQCCVTSPPYFGLRDYGAAGQIGAEAAPSEYVARLVAVFAEVRRVLSDDGTFWLNLGDSYAGGGNGGGGSFSKDGIRCAEPGTDKNKATRFGKRGAVDGLKSKDLIGIPWMVAFALRADGWFLRCDIIWSKPNPMPESVTDRPTKAHEYLFLLSKSERYYYDADAVAEPIAESQIGRVRADPIGGASHVERGQHSAGGVYKQDGHGRRHAGFNARWDAAEDNGETGKTRNRRSVWTIATQPFSEAHFATFPPKLIEPCILAGTKRGDTVLDPFGGAGTTGLVADRLGRNAILIELNPDYAKMAERRIHDDAPLLAELSADRGDR